MVGASSRDIRLTKKIIFNTKVHVLREITENTTVGDLMADERTKDLIKNFTDRNKAMNKEVDSSEKEAITDKMNEEMLGGTPLRTLHLMAYNLTEADYEELLKNLNKAIQ